MKFDNKNIIIQYVVSPIIVFLISSCFIYLMPVVDFLIKFNSAYPYIFSCVLGFIIGFIYWLIGIARKGLLANKAGIFFYSPNNTDKSIEKSKNFLKSNSAVTHRLYILGATGLKTFADKNAPLYDSLRKCQEVRIILVNPYSEAIKKRCKQIGDTNIEEYQQEIDATLNYLSELHEANDKIKVKFYSSEMLWKFIIIDDYVWVQQYSMDKHVASSACYAFERTDSYENIYDYLYNQFIKRWESKRLKVYDFVFQTIKESI